jgi:hypothetical protein
LTPFYALPVLDNIEMDSMRFALFSEQQARYNCRTVDQKNLEKKAFASLLRINKDADPVD